MAIPAIRDNEALQQPAIPIAPTMIETRTFSHPTPAPAVEDISTASPPTKSCNISSTAPYRISRLSNLELESCLLQKEANPNTTSPNKNYPKSLLAFAAQKTRLGLIFVEHAETNCAWRPVHRWSNASPLIHHKPGVGQRIIYQSSECHRPIPRPILP